MKKITFLIVFTLLYNYAYAQLDFLPFSVDYATFKGSNNKTYTEVYIAFFQSELTYQVEDTLQVAHFIHTLKFSQNDSIIQTAVRKYKNTLPLGANTKVFKQFMDVFAFEFEPGSYNLQVITIDDVAQKNGAYNLKVDIPSYGPELCISDIQLSTGIKQAESESNFSSKNNMEILPSPSRTFGLFQPLLYFYFEVYNLSVKNGSNNYFYHYYIIDSDSNIIRDFPGKNKSTSSAIIAETGGTNVITFATNDYFLVLDLEDNISEEKLTVKKKFRIERPTRVTATKEAQKQAVGYEEYVGFSKEELEDEFDKVKYIALDQEEDIFEELDEEGMRKFLAEFWQRRDPEPSTPLNEYKLAYFENLEYAELNYSTAFSRGWKSDRGRVLLIYGKPSEIERFPSTAGSSPYEIWQYYALEGGSMFVFADLSGHGVYELLHSNYRNEINDPNWQQRISGSGLRDF
jgi:GWxTD domain-containing protein